MKFRSGRLIALMVVGLSLSSCTSLTLSDGAETTDSAERSDTSSSDSGPDDPTTTPDGEDAGEADADDADAADADADADTAGSTPDTAAEDQPVAKFTQFDLPSASPDSAIEDASAVALRSDLGSAFVVGSRQEAPGAPQAAVVWTISGGERTGQTVLGLGEGEESIAYDVAVRGDTVAVVGAVSQASERNGAIWWSNDGGATYNDPTIMPNDVTAVTSASFGTDGLIVVGYAQARRQSAEPVIGLPNKNGRKFQPLDGPEGTQVSEVTAFGDEIFISGQAASGTDDRVMFWHSSDGGTTIEQVQGSFDQYASLGPILESGDSYVASAEGTNDASMAIMTSTDGKDWSSRTVSTEYREGGSYPTAYAGGGDIASFEGRLYTDAANGFGQLAELGTDGRGVIFSLADNEKYDAQKLTPFVTSTGLHVLVETERSFAIYTKRGDNFVQTTAPATTGPTLIATQLFSAGDVLAGKVTSAPEVTLLDDGRKQKGPVQLWSNLNGDKFAGADARIIPDDTDTLSYNGSYQLALNDSADDPADAGGGPIAGTSARVRLEGGEWSEPELIRSGPGGEYLQDAAPLGPGFVAVGYDSDIKADGTYETTPVIMELQDGTWGDATIPQLDADQAYLYTVAGESDSGRAIAFGGVVSTEGTTLAFSRSTDGTWSRVELPDASPELFVLDATIDNGEFNVLATDRGRAVVYRSDDGSKFETVNIDIDDPYRTVFNEIIDYNGTQILMGTDSSRRIALWELESNGSLVAFKVEGVGRAWNSSVVNAVIHEGNLWASGAMNGQAVAWQVTLDGGGSAEADAPGDEPEATEPEATDPDTTNPNGTNPNGTNSATTEPQGSDTDDES